MEGRGTTTPKLQHLINLAAAAAIFVVLQVLISHFYLHIPVTLAGERTRVDRDITVTALLRQSKVKLIPGDLLNVRGRVIQTGKGKRPYVVVNGHRVSFASRVHGGDIVAPHNGEDVTEPVITRRVPIAPETKVVGTGRYLAINALGARGIRLDHLGALSRIVTKREVLRKAIPTVLVRTDAPPRKMVALTFDDGPWDNQTMRLADWLVANAVPATFFVMGQQAKRYPAIVRRLDRDGFVIANHSYSHPNLTRLGASEVRNELTWTQKIVQHLTRKKTHWMRPPGGNTNDEVNAITKALKMQPILWDVDSHDWQRPGTKAIVKTVVSEVRPGYSVLMHDGGGDRTQTLQAIPYIVKALRAKGYSFVTMDDLYRTRTVRVAPPAKGAAAPAETPMLAY